MPENRSAPQPPRWRQIYDGIERQLSPRTEALIGSQVFGTVLGFATRIPSAPCATGSLGRPRAPGTCSIFPPEAMSRASCGRSGRSTDSSASCRCRSKTVRVRAVATTVDPDVLVERVRRDAERAVWRARNGIKNITGLGRPSLAPTPYDVEWRHDKVRLIRYRKPGATTTRQPLLLVHSLVSKSYISTWSRATAWSRPSPHGVSMST